MKFLSYEGPIIQFIVKTVNLFLIYFISFVCSIPLVTIGAALSARYYTTVRVLEDKEHSVFKPFFTCFIKNFKQATKIWLIQAMIMAVIILDWIYVYRVGCNRIYWFMLLLVSFIYVSVNMNIFSLQSHYEMSIGALYKTAMLMTVVKCYYSLTVIAVYICIIYLGYVYLSMLPLVIFAGAALILFIHGSFMKKMFSVWDSDDTRTDKVVDQ